MSRAQRARMKIRAAQTAARERLDALEGERTAALSAALKAHDHYTRQATQLAHAEQGLGAALQVLLETGFTTATVAELTDLDEPVVRRAVRAHRQATQPPRPPAPPTTPAS